MNTHRKLLIFLLLLCSLPMAARAAEPDLKQWVGKCRSYGHAAPRQGAGYRRSAEFPAGDCSTQRNLSSEGREQAVRIGERLRAAGLAITRRCTAASGAAARKRRAISRQVPSSSCPH